MYVSMELELNKKRMTIIKHFSPPQTVSFVDVQEETMYWLELHVEQPIRN